MAAVAPERRLSVLVSLMRLICPYVPYDPTGSYNRDAHGGRHFGLAAETHEWIIAHGGELVDVGGGQDAYWRHWCDVWRAQESVINVEHDILPSEAGYRALRSCRQSDWCLVPYRCNGEADGALGLSKFSARLMRRHPDLWERVGQMDDMGVPPRHWIRLDSRLNIVLVQHLGHPGPHVHREHPVQHLHPYGEAT